MSVINKMLRDLDASERPRDDASGKASIADGTVPLAVKGSPRKAQTGQPKWVVLAATVAGMALAAATGAWWWHNSTSVRLPTAPAPQAVVFAPGPAPAPVATSSPVPAPQLPTVVAPVPAAMARPMRPSGESTPVKAEATSAVKSSVSPAVAPAPPPVAVATPAPPLATVRNAAAADVLEDAQKLWEKGARDAAVQLLRERLDATDATVQAGGSVATLWLWLSELTRMEVAQGHSAQALRRLERFESTLSSNASAWATRGNLAQRLGRHGESAQAYLAALAIRPDEPRWMLGAAVSLAADGRTAQAADWAKRAQSRGALNPEISAYLRQQGVALQ